MGPASSVETIATAARAIDAVPAIADLWATDHVAISPDDAEGSEGRYLDPLATLAFVAGITKRVGLGTGVLILPYRPALPTAKWIASIQELSCGRMLLGVGVGWMEAEFRALGIARGRRGRTADETLAFLNRCFGASDDIVESNGQPFLFRPKPALPPIFVGGAPPHAFRRAIVNDAGWMPAGLAPDILRPLVEMLNQQAQEAGVGRREVIAMTSLPLADRSRARDRLAEYEAAGATRIVHGERYTVADELHRIVDSLAGLT